jgi:hypothetical protein
MASVHSMLGFSRVPSLHVLVYIVVVGGVLVSASPVQGQVRSFSQSPSEGPTHSSQLPDWAEPAAPPAGSEPTSSSENNSTPTEDMREGVRTRAVPPPGEKPVPVDGGLALLAAAGAGYAVRRLNLEDDESQE